MVQCRLSSPASILVHSPPLPWIQDLYIAQPKVCEVANQSLVWSTNQKEWTKIKLTITEKNPHLNKTLAFSVWMKYGVEALDFWDDLLWAIISYLICWGSIMSSSVTCSAFTGLVPAWGLLEWLMIVLCMLLQRRQEYKKISAGSKGLPRSTDHDLHPDYFTPDQTMCSLSLRLVCTFSLNDYMVLLLCLEIEDLWKS